MSFKFGHTALDVVRKYHPKVTKVVDATKPLTIAVIEEDCAKGKSKAPNSCALAHTEGKRVNIWYMRFWVLAMLPRWWWRGYGWQWDIFVEQCKTR